MSAQYSNDDGISMTYRRRWQGEQEAEAVIESLAVSGRPLVVIDPEDREAVDGICKALVEAMYAAGDERSAANGVYPATVAAALREFANPTPPRPDEPTGLGAVVEDKGGLRWMRWHTPGGPLHPSEDRPWQCANGEGSDREWSDIHAVRVLSEGVQP